MDDKEKFKGEIKDIIEKEGFEMIEFKLSFYHGIYSLCCLVDHLGGGITMEECADLNKKISSYLDNNKVLGDNYTLEVNSPGLDRPLKNRNDFLRVKGRTVSLWFKKLVADKPSLEAEILDISDKGLVVRYKKEVLEVGFDNIKMGKEKIIVI